MLGLILWCDIYPKQPVLCRSAVEGNKCFEFFQLESYLRIQVLGPPCRLKYNFITNSAVILDKLHDLCASNSVTVKLHASFINPTNMTEDS